MGLEVKKVSEIVGEIKNLLEHEFTNVWSNVDSGIEKEPLEPVTRRFVTVMDGNAIGASPKAGRMTLTWLSSTFSILKVMLELVDSEELTFNVISPSYVPTTSAAAAVVLSSSSSLLQEVVVNANPNIRAAT
jgi:hypothetical protein